MVAVPQAAPKSSGLPCPWGALWGPGVCPDWNFLAVLGFLIYCLAQQPCVPHRHPSVCVPKASASASGAGALPMQSILRISPSRVLAARVTPPGSLTTPVPQPGLRGLVRRSAQQATADEVDTHRSCVRPSGLLQDTCGSVLMLPLGSSPVPPAQWAPPQLHRTGTWAVRACGLSRTVSASALVLQRQVWCVAHSLSRLSHRKRNDVSCGVSDRCVLRGFCSHALANTGNEGA